MTRDELAQAIRRRTPVHADELIEQLDAYVAAERERIAQAVEAMVVDVHDDCDDCLALRKATDLARRGGSPDE